MLIITLAMSTLTSCNKEELESPEQELLKEGAITLPTASSIAIRDNQLVFASVEIYETMLDNGELSANHLNSLFDLSYANFPSLYKKLNQNTEALSYNQAVYGYDEEEDSPILNILNEHEIVTIGDWVIKVDLAHKIVGVTQTGNANLQEALSTDDFSNSRVFWFGTEDDVILLLEEGSQGTLSQSDLLDRINKSIQRNHQIAAKTYDPKDCNFNPYMLDSTTNFLKDKKVVISEARCGQYVENCEKWLADAKHVYQKAGVYFSLQSKIKYRGNVDCRSNAPWAINTDLTARVSYYYERRRRFKKNIKRSGTLTDSKYSNELNIRSYSGSRSLKHYRLNSTFTYRRKDDCASQFNCPVNNYVVTIVMPQIDD